MSAQSRQAGIYPFSNQGHNAPSVDPRIAASDFTQQMPGSMGAMNLNQQRQLMLMQQQKRNSSGNLNMNAPNFVNPQRAPLRLSSQPPMQPEDFQWAMTQQAQPGMMGTQQNTGSFHLQVQYHQWQNGQHPATTVARRANERIWMNPRGGAGAANSPYGSTISPSGGPNWQQQSMNGCYPKSNQRP
ncbi:hypothetical protein C8R48DRAFT_812862 [Suillus tomentosus]|nr:hypothetical protein C8R48DRAFT_812862 [Suillus tomentosus]